MEDAEPNIDEAAAVTADLLTWHSAVGCFCHDIHNALKWSAMENTRSAAPVSTHYKRQINPYPASMSVGYPSIEYCTVSRNLKSREPFQMHSISNSFIDLRSNQPILWHYSSDETPMATTKRWTFGIEVWQILRKTKASKARLIQRAFVIDVHCAAKSSLDRPLQCPDKTCPTFFSGSRK